ncbi:hypothetical protein [Kamptonema formosum]|uniref:hypothetical protein n=1 Tax=Kamptonema formosum TaxID=331992 RepID=UPI000345850D|nr:hypothetical protein [Oscillatoria sp. PCC 10802]
MIRETELWCEELSDGEAAAVAGGGAETLQLLANYQLPAGIDTVIYGLGPTAPPLPPVPPCIP